MRLTKSAQHFAVCHQSPWLKDFQLIPAQPDCQPLPPLPLKQSGSRVKGYHGAAFAKQRHLNNAAKHSKPRHLCICLHQASWYHFALLHCEQRLGDRATFLTTGTHPCSDSVHSLGRNELKISAWTTQHLRMLKGLVTW